MIDRPLSKPEQKALADWLGYHPDVLLDGLRIDASLSDPSRYALTVHAPRAATPSTLRIPPTARLVLRGADSQTFSVFAERVDEILDRLSQGYGEALKPSAAVAAYVDKMLSDVTEVEYGLRYETRFPPPQGDEGLEHWAPAEVCYLTQYDRDATFERMGNSDQYRNVKKVRRLVTPWKEEA